MRRESRLLFTKAVDSLVLSIDHYNRPWDRGRIDAVLILLDHSFEMLLKAAILHRGGAIQRDARASRRASTGPSGCRPPLSASVMRLTLLDNVEFCS